MKHAFSADTTRINNNNKKKKKKKDINIWMEYDHPATSILTNIRKRTFKESQICKLYEGDRSGNLNSGPKQRN
jgi:hypothetical protein